MKKFIMLEHTADLKFRVFGKSLKEIFENSASAFSEYISSGKKILGNESRILEVSGSDLKSLLYNFLDELIYILDAEDFAVSKASIEIKDNDLKAKLFGEHVSKNMKLKHVKAATYAEMLVKKISDKNWEAEFVLDV